MVNTEIQNYIIEGKKRGFSFHLLKQKLLEGGFDEAEIDEAISSINKLPVVEKKGNVIEKTEVKKKEVEKPGEKQVDIKKHEEILDKSQSHKDAEFKDKDDPKENQSTAFLEQSLKKYGDKNKSFFEDQPYTEINPKFKIKKPGVFQKIGNTFSHPQNTFEETFPERLWPALKFQLIILVVPLLMLIIMSSFFMNFVTSNSPELLGTSQVGVDINEKIVSFSENSTWIRILYITLFTYIIFPLFTFVAVGLFHLIIYVFGGKGTYSDTYRAVVYGSTPIVLLGLVPFLNLAAIVWGFILELFGISVNHKISKMRAFFIILSVILLIVVIWLGIYVIQLYGG